jgi:hypothetical protein
MQEKHYFMQLTGAPGGWESQIDSFTASNAMWTRAEIICYQATANAAPTYWVMFKQDV